eukprot:251194-Rhodomonas_salina.1
MQEGRGTRKEASGRAREGGGTEGEGEERTCGAAWRAWRRTWRAAVALPLFRSNAATIPTASSSPSRSPSTSYHACPALPHVTLASHSDDARSTLASHSDHTHSHLPS